MKKEHFNEIKKAVPWVTEDRVFLNGSRYMLPRVTMSVEIPEGTDYDYAIDRVEVRDINRFFSKGWKEVLTESYKDANTSCVFEKIIDGDKVQVMSRIDLDEYIYAFTKIKPNVYYSMWRDRRRDDLTAALEEGYIEYQNTTQCPF